MIDDADVSARLAALPSPPMPDDVLALIDARLAEEHTVVPMTRHHTRRLNWLVAAAAVLGLFALIGVTARPAPGPVTATAPMVTAGASFLPAGFGQQIETRMLAANPAKTTGSFADSPSTITACTKAVKAYGSVRYLDVGTYDRTAAVVIVTSYPASATYEEVWVVSPDCSPANPVVYRHMLYDVDATLPSV